MNEELLISLVQSYSELYNQEDPRYHDDQRRMNIWEEISKIMNETLEEELEVRAAEPIVPPDPHYPPLATAVPAGASAVRRPATARAAAS
ncbi:unnamed protein product [Parnassius apollo]|uniref:(apollo) hypothetical protein n=1 Tax=Parnassius apollo TaxID=110799 RepID=A0A8S3XRY1_PARAO|nr:unnamed protein product [Parnassius apollo]